MRADLIDGPRLDACDWRILEAAETLPLQFFRQGWASGVRAERFHRARVSGLTNAGLLALGSVPEGPRLYLSRKGRAALADERLRVAKAAARPATLAHGDAWCGFADIDAMSDE